MMDQDILNRLFEDQMLEVKSSSTDTDDSDGLRNKVLVLVACKTTLAYAQALSDELESMNALSELLPDMKDDKDQLNEFYIKSCIETVAVFSKVMGEKMLEINDDVDAEVNPTDDDIEDMIAAMKSSLKGIPSVIVFEAMRDSSVIENSPLDVPNSIIEFMENKIS